MSSILNTIYQHSEISQSDLDRIVDAHHLKTIKKGEYLLREGRVAQEYQIIQSGLVQSYAVDYDGNEHTIDFYGPSDIAIEVLSIFQRIPTQENMVALVDTEVWAMGFDKFQELFLTIPGLSEWGRAWMSGQLFAEKQRSLSMITKSASERYVELLQSKPEIIQQVPLKKIASYLGITDTSLSRIRKEIAASKG